MKKQLRFIFYFSLAYFSIDFVNAQDTVAVKNNAHKHYRWHGGLQISTPYNYTAEYLEAHNGFYPGKVKDKSAFSLGIQTNFLMREYILRLKAGVCNRVETNHGDSSSTAGAGDVFDEIIKQNIIYSSLGVGRILNYKYINIYGGVELPLIYYGQYSHNYTFINFENGSLTTGGGSVTSPGGFAIGLGVFAGIDFFLLKRISIGVEFSNSCLYSKTGGEQSVHNWATGYNNYDGTEVLKNSKEQIIVPNVKPSINISYHF